MTLPSVETVAHLATQEAVDEVRAELHRRVAFGESVSPALWDALRAAQDRLNPAPDVDCRILGVSPYRL